MVKNNWSVTHTQKKWGGVGGRDHIICEKGLIFKEEESKEKEEEDDEGEERKISKK